MFRWARLSGVEILAGLMLDVSQVDDARECLVQQSTLRYQDHIQYVGELVGGASGFRVMHLVVYIVKPGMS